MKSYTKNKLPAFFEFAKDKSKDQVEKSNDSTMNRISKSIPSSRISYCKTISKFDYRMLMNQKKNLLFLLIARLSRLTIIGTLINIYLILQQKTE